MDLIDRDRPDPVRAVLDQVVLRPSHHRHHRRRRCSRRRLRRRRRLAVGWLRPCCVAATAAAVGTEELAGGAVDGGRAIRSEARWGPSEPGGQRQCELPNYSCSNLNLRSKYMC